MVKEHNDSSHAHDHYEFFRSMYAATYDVALDEQLENRMAVFDKISKTPVLLSLLISAYEVGLGARQQRELPRNIFKLYEAAVGAALGRHMTDEREADAALRVLAQIGVGCHLEGTRIFTGEQVEKFLTTAQDRDLWWDLVKESKQENGVPLIRILKAPVETGGETRLNSEFQFRHLSFAEYFFVRKLINEEAGAPSIFWSPATDELPDCDTVSRRLNESRHKNMYQIGGDVLAKKLVEHHFLNLNLKLSKTGSRAFELLFMNGFTHTVTKLDMSGSEGLDVGVITSFPALQFLNLKGCRGHIEATHTYHGVMHVWFWCMHVWF